MDPGASFLRSSRTTPASTREERPAGRSALLFAGLSGVGMDPHSFQSVARLTHAPLDSPSDRTSSARDQQGVVGKLVVGGYEPGIRGSPPLKGQKENLSPGVVARCRRVVLRSLAPHHRDSPLAARMCM